MTTPDAPTTTYPGSRCTGSDAAARPTPDFTAVPEPMGAVA